MSKIISARPCSLFGLLLWWAALSLSVQSSPLEAQEAEQDQAVRLFQRLTGQAPTLSELQEMISAIQRGNTDIAALIAIRSDNLGFYKSTLVDAFSRTSNLEAVRPSSLDEYSATVVGLAVQNEDFRDVFRNVIYTAGDEEQTYFYRKNVDTDGDGNGDTLMILPINVDGNPLIRVVDNPGNNDNFLNEDGTPASTPKVRPLLRNRSVTGSDIRFELSNGAHPHYQDLEKVSDWPLRLEKRSQSQMYSYVRSSDRIPADDVIGLLSLPTMGRSAFEAGTNRRGYKMIMSTFMCKEMEEIRDATAPDFRVRRDIVRGDNFQTECRSCHGNMDGMNGAFAFFDYRDGRLQYDANGLNGNPSNNDYANGSNQKKQWRQNNNYLPGHLIKNNSWYNFMTAGQNVTFGWRTPSTGQDIDQGVGARSLGETLANTEQFSNCMAERAYERVCLDSVQIKSEDSDSEKQRKRALLGKLAEIAREYEQGIADYDDFSASSPYNINALFAKVAGTCFGGNQ